MSEQVPERLGDDIIFRRLQRRLDGGSVRELDAVGVARERVVARTSAEQIVAGAARMTRCPYERFDGRACDSKEEDAVCALCEVYSNGEVC